MNFPVEGPFMLWWATPQGLFLLLFFLRVSYFFNILLVIWVFLLCTGASLAVASKGAQHVGAVAVAHGLRRYSSLACGAQAQQLCCRSLSYLVRFSQTRNWGRCLSTILPERSRTFLLLSPLRSPAFLGHLLRPCVHSEAALCKVALVHQHFCFLPASWHFERPFYLSSYSSSVSLSLHSPLPSSVFLPQPCFALCKELSKNLKYLREAGAISPDCKQPRIACGSHTFCVELVV